ncbi:MAG TPA: dihydropyrimidinase [Candidatus Limnocylindrales bacterium]|nr:dihydropyrimidinase [Candidatus Limnocylindrales bacterium]
MTDLIVTGGMVVTAQRSFLADVAITDGRIEAVGEGLARRHPTTATLDAGGLMVLPGVVDVHTHTRLPTDELPDRFYTDSVAAAHGGTTTFLAFNNPGTGISDEGAASLLAGMREFRGRTDGESAVDYALSSVLGGHQSDPIAELPALVDAGVPTAKAFMVYDFRLADDRLFEALRTMGRLGGMLQVHCENATIIDELTRRAMDAGNTGCRHHALCRPSYAEAEATHRAIALAQAAEASVYIVHLSCADALAEVVAAKARGWPVYAETCPQYLSRTDAAYEAPDEAEMIRSVISPPLRSEGDRQALWLGLATPGGLDLVASDHVPDRLAVEKKLPAPPFPQISNGAPGIETLLVLTYTFGPAAGRVSVERMVDVLATTPARLFGLPSKGAVEVGRDADLVLFDPGASHTIGQASLHHTSDFTPYEGMAVRGKVRSVLLRGQPVVRDGIFVGRRGRGRFQERHLDATVETMEASPR